MRWKGRLRRELFTERFAYHQSLRVGSVCTCAWEWDGSSFVERLGRAETLAAGGYWAGRRRNAKLDRRWRDGWMDESAGRRDVFFPFVVVLTWFDVLMRWG